MNYRNTISALAFACVTASLPCASAQDATASPEPQTQQEQPNSGAWRRFGTAQPIPAKLTLTSGAWITIRIDQRLSSDRNQPGDPFTATLAQPLVADGLVVARRGQTVGGRVASVQKAGRVKGTSSMGLELTEVTLADGRQLPLQTQLIQYTGDTSVGRDATAIGATTGVGAAIGAAAAGGSGAAIGAGAGAIASTIGVLLTRGHATVVNPEAALTFRVTSPATIDTGNSAMAFQAVQQGDYGPRLVQRSAAPRPAYYGGSYYDPFWSPYYYGGFGPRLGFYYGGRGGFGGRRR